MLETTPAICTPEGISEHILDASTSVPAIIFPFWLTLCQLLIMALGAVFAILSYLPLLVLLLQQIVKPASLPPGSPCQATIYCQGDQLCDFVPTVDVAGLRFAPATTRQCISERYLDSQFFEASAHLEILQSQASCKPVNTTMSCTFPFEWQGTEYTTCTKAPTPDGTISPAVAWCKTSMINDTFNWAECLSPCDEDGLSAVEPPATFKNDTWASYTGLSFFQILWLVLVGELSSTFIGWLVTGLLLRALTLMKCCCCDWGDKDKNQPNDRHTNEVFPVASGRFLVQWWVCQLIEASGKTAGPLQGTLFMQLWVRPMGARVKGWNLEFSSSTHVGLETLTIGEGAFIAGTRPRRAAQPAPCI